MLHDICLDGHAFRLRPINTDDARLIINLRADQPERTKYLHSIKSSINDQEKYLNQYLERPNDYYFVLERLKDNKPEGLISIYDIDPLKRSGEWGRWVLADISLGAVESCLLIYKIAFMNLDLQRLYCRTIINNQSVTSFHDDCGLERNHILSNYFELNGQYYDAIEHSIDRDSWSLSIDLDLDKKSKLIARRLN